MNLLAGAFRSISRRLVRTLLIGTVLGLSVAVLVSTIAGVQASQKNTQSMVDGVTNSTADLIAGVDANTTKLVANVDACTQSLVDKINKRTQEIVDAINTSTAAMVAQVQAGANQTIGLAGMSATQIMVMSSSKSGAISDSDITAISALSNIKAVVPSYSYRVGGTGDPRTQDWDYILQGVPLDNALIKSYSLLPTVIIEGRALNSTDANGVMISSDLLTYFGNPDIGATIKLKDVSFTLVGIYYPQNVSDQKTIYLDWKAARDFAVKYPSTDTAQTVIPIGPGGFGGGGTGGLVIQVGQSLSLRVYVDSTDNLNTVAAAIESYNKNLSVRTPNDTMGGNGGQFNTVIQATQADQIQQIQRQATQQIAQAQASATAQLTDMQNSVATQKAQTQADAQKQKDAAQTAANSQITSLQSDQSRVDSMGMLISIIAAVAGTLIIFGIMFYTLRERTREIGIYKALGFSNMQATIKFMLEGSFIGVLGGILGIVLAMLSYSLLVNNLLKVDNAGSLPVSYLAMGLGLAIGVATIGSLYPAWQASRISPLVALKNDK